MDSIEDNNLDIIVKKFSLWIGGSALVFFIITLLIYFYYYHGEISHDHDKWGQFGDYLGGTLSPIFSLLSLIAILLTLLFQAKEMYSSTESLKKQSKHTEMQAFESTFFSMIMLHNENLKGLDLEDTETQTYTGRSVFKVMLRKLKDFYNASDNTNELHKIRDAYNKFYSSNSKFIGHYLRTLNQLIEYILNSGVDNKSKYINLLIAQLSEMELSIVFYHSMVNDSFISFDTLRNYGFFKEFRNEAFINIDIHKAYLE